MNRTMLRLSTQNTNVSDFANLKMSVEVAGVGRRAGAEPLA